MKTRATQLIAPGEIVLGERELTLGPEDVLVKGHLSGICGSDKAMYRGEIPEKITLPLWIGHESGGTVVEVGAKVREYAPGDKVMVFNWCNTFADYYRVPVSGLQPVPPVRELRTAIHQNTNKKPIYQGFCAFSLYQSILVALRPFGAFWCL